MPDKPVDVVICGDVLEKLPEIPTGTVHCCVTSPPYWGLRDYGVAGQLGLEKTPEEYVAKMVAVFREVWRVLRDDGTLWLNMGDTYARDGGAVTKPGATATTGNTLANVDTREQQRAAFIGLKPKDLCGVPWRLAFALQGFAVVPFQSFSIWADELKLARETQDWEAVQIVEGKLRRMDFLAGLQSQGWYLRQDIIWHKPNPMPESVRDRCTKAHEYIFLMTKKPKYYCDMEAIREPSKNPQDDIRRITKNQEYNQKYGQDKMAARSFHKGKVYDDYTPNGRNKRSVWTVPTAPYSEAHFATFPPDLILPCILAGCPQQVCKKCGEPRRRITETEQIKRRRKTPTTKPCDDRSPSANDVAGVEVKTTGWTDCGCNAGFDGGVVLDPFMGSGTVAVVAYQNNRHYLGIELNPEYCKLGRIEKEKEKYGLFGKT